MTSLEKQTYTPGGGGEGDACSQLGWGGCSRDCRAGREDGWMKESGLGLHCEAQCEGEERFVQERQVKSCKEKKKAYCWG